MHVMKVFISHVFEEAALAQALKEWIESAFLGQCTVFVSSDSTSLPAGTRWLEKLDQELNDAKVMLVLCSPAALQRPWINFETGCAWSRRISVIPACHSGQTRGALPVPISSFQALELDEADFESKLLTSVAKHLGFPKVPKIDFATMRTELRQALGHVRPTPLNSNPSEPIQALDLAEECIQILTMMAARGESVIADYIAQRFAMSGGKALYFIEILEAHDLIRRHYDRGAACFMATSEGRRFLVERGLL